MSILSQIVDTKRKEVSYLKQTLSLEEIKQQALQLQHSSTFQRRDFIQAIQHKHQHNKSAVIAEIKKASPSKGIICTNFIPEQIAQEYEKNGAACLSVLTDEDYFKGKIEYLEQARQATNLPVLRKDFIVDEYQIYQSALIGADAILLIASILSAEQMQYFEEIAHSLNLAVLPEIHHDDELEKSIKLKTKLLGINNRNLATFSVDLAQTINLLHKIDNKIIVTESGILAQEDVKLMQSHNVNTFLVGEAFMRENSPIASGKALSNLFFY
ncbi:MAG: Indole-3-glycerol phosphate synthase [Pseudomonadota bacterium]|jgi:indole-3-glycerol phosphate synthase